MPFEGLFKPVLGGRFLTQPPWQGCSPSPCEGRAGRGTGRGAIRTELLRIGFPLSLTLSPLLRRGEKEILPAHLWWQYQHASGNAGPKRCAGFRAHFTFAPVCR